MALTVEDGTGLSSADSYVTLVAANARATAHGWAEWTYTDAQKEVALRQATLWIDARFMFAGIRKRKEQALQWPRDLVVDDLGYSVTGVPLQVKNATIEAARLFAAGRLGGLGPAASLATKRLKADTVEIEYGDKQAVTDVRLFDAVDEAMGIYGVRKGRGMVPLMKS